MEILTSLLISSLIFLNIFGVSGNSAENPMETSGFMDGDIKSVAPSLLRGRTRSGLVDESFRWPNATVPYEFSTGYDFLSKFQFQRAMDHISHRTCIKFVPHTDENDYVIVISDPKGCYSHVGRIGGKQDMSLPSKCRSLSTHVHEIIHALGYWHEQNRSDRDDYVTINYENIRPEYKFAFDVQDGTSAFGMPYDYTSVMHYPRSAFSKNGRDTIATKSIFTRIGNSRGMSSGDIAKVNHMYCRDSQAESTTQQQPKLKLL